MGNINDGFAVAAEFVERHVKRNTRASSARETERFLAKAVLPMWGNKRIQDVTKRQVLDLLDGEHGLLQDTASGLGIVAPYQLKDAIAFIMLVLILIFRPTGILGERLAVKKA